MAKQAKELENILRDIEFLRKEQNNHVPAWALAEILEHIKEYIQAQEDEHDKAK